ncbi:MAG: glycosyltransferase [Deltaproteobacteria bacterium]|nr:glycosyltransferase [Deltaproteobacteria bacterium]
MMRILNVIASGAIGGGSTHLLKLLPVLARQGVNIRVLVGSDGPLTELLRNHGIETEYVNLMRSRIDPWAPFNLARQIKKNNTDIVHYHGTRAAFFGALARPLMPKIPSIYTVHGLSYSQRHKGIKRKLALLAERICCANVDEIISVSKHDRDDLVRRGFILNNHATTIANPVEVKSFTADSRQKIRAKIGIAPDEFVVVTVARLVEQKGLDILIRAISKCNSLMKCIIIGDGPLRSKLIEQATAENINIIFMGERNDVDKLWPAFDLFVLSSRWEGEPIALLEAMAAGIPCICTATAGAKSALGDQSQIVPIDDYISLAAYIDKVACLTFALRKLMGNKLQERIKNRSPEKIAAKMLEIYKKVKN